MSVSTGLNKYQIKFIYSIDGRKAHKLIRATSKETALKEFEKVYEGWVVEVYSIDLVEENVEPIKYKK